MRRFILTGAPGAGKTTLIQALAARGHAVVEEAATDVNAEMLAAGVVHPSEEADFIDRIVAMQIARRDAADATPQVHDRSPICTLALCRLLDRAPPPSLTADLGAIAREEIYERRVFFVRNLGFMTPTPVRRISFEDSLRFEVLHEQAYRELGYELVMVPAMPLEDRLAQIEAAI
jgi:predicted ATPase